MSLAGAMVAPVDGREKSSRSFRWAVGIVAAFFVTDLCWYLFRFGGQSVTHWWSDLSDVPVTLIASLMCIFAARRQTGRTKLAWLLLGAGMTCWGLGELVWSYYELILHREVPFPSLADAGFLLLIPFMAVALLSLPTAPRAAAARGRVILDGMIIATSLFVLSWATALGATFAQGGNSLLETILSLAYPFGDVVLIGLVLFVGSRSARMARSSIGLIGAGIVFISISDSLFTFFTAKNIFGSDMASDLLGLGWMAGWLLIALGALRARTAAGAIEDSPSSRFSAFLPYIGVVLALPTITIRLFTEKAGADPVLLVATVVLFVVVAVRQLVTVFENRTLAEHFEVKVAERTQDLADAFAKLEVAMEAQERMHAAQREFVRIAAHELHTPTVPIATFAAMLLERWDTTPDAMKHQQVEVIDRQARRLRRLTTMLLGISRIDSGNLDIDPRDIDVRDEISSLLTEMNRRSAPVELDCDPSIRVHADPDYFRSIVGNLLENAFTHGMPPVRVWVVDEGGWVSLFVADAGDGVAEDFQPRLFDKFAQAELGSNVSASGVGVGLFSARELARAHGGDAWYESNRDGHAFGVRLPGVQSEPSASLREAG